MCKLTISRFDCGSANASSVLNRAAAEEARKSASHVIQGFIIAITPRVKGREDGYEFNSNFKSSL